MSGSAATADRQAIPARRVAILLALISVLQPLAGALSPVFGVGEPIGERARAAGIPPELPPGIFFSIWSVIFLLFAVCAFLAWRNLPAGLAGRAGPPLILAGAGNIVWMLQSQIFGFRALEFLLLVPILVAACLALREALRGSDRSGSALVWLACTGLLAGWVSVATSIAWPPVLREVAGLGPTDLIWPISLGVLGLLAVITLTVASVAGLSLFYLAAVIWGLAGVALNLFQRVEAGLIGWTVIVFAIIGTLLLLRRFGLRHVNDHSA